MVRKKGWTNQELAVYKIALDLCIYSPNSFLVTVVTVTCLYNLFGEVHGSALNGDRTEFLQFDPLHKAPRDLRLQ